MSKFLDCIFSELIHAFCKRHRKIQNDEQIYMELKNMKHEEIERVEVYYVRIQKLPHGLQIPTTNNFMIITFKVGLQLYFIIAIVGMKRSTLQHKEASMLFEEGMTTTEVKNALLVPQSTK